MGLEYVGALFASIGGVGLISLAASTTAVGQATLVTVAFLRKKFNRSAKAKLEEIGPVVAVIYQKVSRRLTLLSLLSFGLAGGILINLPANIVSDGTEFYTDSAVGVTSLLSFAMVAFTRRSQKQFGFGWLLPNKQEFKLLIAYENIVDIYLKQTLAAKGIINFIDANYLGEIESLVFIPKSIEDTEALNLSEANTLSDLVSLMEKLGGEGNGKLKAYSLNNLAVKFWQLQAYKQAAYAIQEAYHLLQKTEDSENKRIVVTNFDNIVTDYRL